MKFVGCSKTKISVLKDLDNLSIEPVALDVRLEKFALRGKTEE